jgi:hypothetical protein
MSKSTKSQNLPTRDEFVTFWEGQTTFHWREVMPLAIYLGGLATAAVISHRAGGRFAIPIFCGALAFAILSPILYAVFCWKRYERFIR